MLGIAVVAIGGFMAYNAGFFSKLKSAVFGADEITPADAERIDIERTGLTADVVPESLVSSFMGYKFLDLAHTSAVVNERPWGTGVTDQQVVYANPNDLGYSDKDLENTYSAESIVDRDTRKPTPLEGRNRVFNADYYGPNILDNTVGQLPRSLASSVSSPDKIQHQSTGVVSLDPATGQTAGITYQGPVPCCVVPPEVNRDFPFAVTPYFPPFETPPTGGQGFGGNRFGSLSRNSDESTVNGRFGQGSLNPDVNSSYVGSLSGRTASLSSWRAGGTIIQTSDTEARYIPHGGGQEEFLRRV